MIKIVREDGIAQPFIFCAICGERIISAQMGAALNAYNSEQGSTVDVVYVHKGNCRDVAEKNLNNSSGKVTQWQELEKHLSWLLQNSGLTIVRLQELEQDEK